MHHSSARERGRNQFVRLLEAAARLGRAEVTELLLDAGADPNILTRQSVSAIDYATFDGHIDIIHRLVAAGADPNGGGDGTWTPLHHAVLYGNVELVEILLVAGADPTLVNTDGETAAQVARSRGYHAVARLIEEAARSG